jgi:hypothetical protein
MQPQLKYRGIPIATQHRCVSPLGVIVAVDGTRGAKIRGAVRIVASHRVSNFVTTIISGTRALRFQCRSDFPICPICPIGTRATAERSQAP